MKLESMAVSSPIRLTHTVIPVSVMKLGAPARVSARSSLPFSGGVSIFSGARQLVLSKAKQRGEGIIEDKVPIEDSMDASTVELVSVELTRIVPYHVKFSDGLLFYLLG